jgi:tetratricopeptide (TPR) repeat protein
MDNFDKLISGLLIVLVTCTTALIFTRKGDSQMAGNENRQLPARQHVTHPELDNQIGLAKKILAENNLEKTAALVDLLISQFPYEGEPYFLRGDLLVRRQQPIAAMHEYRSAVELNPDFLDKKTQLFQGKKIKFTLEEARSAIETGLQQEPGNLQLKDDRKVFYYMKRKLAGGCG